MKQLGLFDRENLYARINKGGDPLVKLNKVIEWDTFVMLSEKVVFEVALCFFHKIIFIRMS